VIVIAGKDKGKRGAVLRVVDDDHLLVEGINLVKKHQTPNPMKGTAGGIVDKEMPLNVSNVAIYNPVTQKGDRVGIRVLDDGRRVRVFRSNGEMIDA
jgi:large subunit ribosomal protein L24